MIQWLRRLLPAGFRGQVAGILLLGLVLSQGMAAVLYMVLLPHWQKVLRPELAVTKVTMVVKLLESVPPAERPSFAALWSEADFQVSYADGGSRATAPLEARSPDPALRAQLAAALHRGIAAVQVDAAEQRASPDRKRIAVALEDGSRITVVTSVGRESRLGFLEQVAIAAFMVFATAGLWAWLTWTVNRPLTRFSHAAERVGLDVHAPRLPEQGPAQLKRAIRAFNEMQVRLQRFLSDRTRMLGAISHDLRTPLTRMRLRIETDRVVEEKAKMLGDIEIMESMLASTLAFIRGVDEVEAPEVVDLDSLLQTACDLVCDLGGDVTFSGPGRTRYHCRPQSIMRALTNVVENATKYGGRATVTLLAHDGFTIDVDDDGPGIADAEKGKVFEPFYRTASARDSDSRGMGLGLAIARSVILAHGGTIDLHDRQPHGLRVRIFLPQASTALVAPA